MNKFHNKADNDEIYKFLIEEIFDKDAIFDLIYHKMTDKYPEHLTSNVNKQLIEEYLKKFSQDKDKFVAAKKTIEEYNLEHGKANIYYQDNSVLDVIFKRGNNYNLNNINSDFYEFLNFIGKNLKMTYEFIGNTSSEYFYLTNESSINMLYSKEIEKNNILTDGLMNEFIKPSNEIKMKFMQKILSDRDLSRELEFSLEKVGSPCAIFLESTNEYLHNNVFYKHYRTKGCYREDKTFDKHYPAQIIDFSALGLFDIDVESVEELEEFLYIIINLPEDLMKHIKLNLNVQSNIFNFSFTRFIKNNSIDIIENNGEISRKIGQFLYKKPIHNREQVIKIINNISKYNI